MAWAYVVVSDRVSQAEHETRVAEILEVVAEAQGRAEVSGYSGAWQRNSFTTVHIEFDSAEGLVNLLLAGISPEDQSPD